MLLVLMFLTEFRVDLDECRDGKRDQTEEHDDDKERAVAQHVFHPSRHHARQHQAQIRDGGAEGIVRCLEVALREVEHIESQCRKAQTIAELLDEDARADQYQVVRHGITHIASV